MSGRLRTQVAIVGGGLVGCSAALHLARERVPVALLERDTVGSRASGVNFGGVRQQGRAVAELPLARRSRSLWENVGTLVGCDCEFAATGHLKLAATEAEFAELEAYAAVARRHGLRLDLLDRNRLRERHPWLSESLAGGSFCAEDGAANPRLAGPAFARAARSAGAVILEGERVEGIERRSTAGGFLVRAASGLEVEADVLINAAGAWGPRFAETFGETAPLTPVAPQMFATEPIPYFVEPVLGVVGGAIYLRQIPRGNILFGGGRGIVREGTLRSDPIEAHFRATVELAGRLIPRLRSIPVIRSWTGIEGDMADGLPVLGRSRVVADLYHAFGFSGHGFQLAPAVGAVLADLIARGRTETDIAAFDIGRFSTAPGRTMARAGHREIE